MVAGQTAPAVFKLAIAALGGQGGGVLTQWLLSAAEASGFLAQATSVPGVAQRTGATLYYLEFFPRATAEAAGAQPVLALMPNPGDVDLMVASELLEAGRAIQRGLVSRDRTTLVTSTHRVFTIGEKSALGDGLADSETVMQVARATAKRLVALDMEAVARQSGSIISSVVLGALAGSGALPFPAVACEQAIRKSGRALETNLAAFESGRSRAKVAAGTGPASDDGHAALQADSAQPFDPVPAPGNKRAQLLMARISSEFPSACAGVLGIGVHRLVDYQNHAYAGLYLDRLLEILTLDSASRHYKLLREAARGLALWMSYEDTARVADLKTRAARFARVRAEGNAGEGQVMRIVDYLSPRVEEIAGSLPAWLGEPLLKWRVTRRRAQRLYRRQENFHRPAVGLLAHADNGPNPDLAAQHAAPPRRGRADSRLACYIGAAGADRLRTGRADGRLPGTGQGLRRDFRARVGSLPCDQECPADPADPKRSCRGGTRAARSGAGR